MKTRQDGMEDRLSALEDKLTLLQATLDGLPEALARYLVVMQPQLQPIPSSSNESPAGELQRRHQFLHPESAHGSGNDGGAGTNAAIPVTVCRGASTGNRSSVPAPSTSSNGSVTAQQQPPPPSKPKLH